MDLPFHWPNDYWNRKNSDTKVGFEDPIQKHFQAHSEKFSCFGHLFTDKNPQTYVTINCQISGST